MAELLYTTAHNYHTTYLNQLLIHAQRPDAAACASMEYWNKQANRLVMRGSRSITVLQRRQGVAVTKPVFAIGDTTLLSQTRTGGPWEVTDTTRPLLLQGKSDDWLAAQAQEGVSNDADRARRMLERNVADSTLQWAQPDEQMQLLQALVTQSAVYIARLRIGLPVQDEDFPAFQSVSQFDTYQISLCLGGYLQAAAEPMLNAIGREALRLNRDSIAIPHEPVHNESTPTQLNSREEAIHHDVHEEPRRLPDSEPFLPNQPNPYLNRYARLRLEYLEQNEPTLCDQLMLESTLLTSCSQVGLAAQLVVDKTLRELMQTTQLPDRRTNPLGWTQMTNSLKKQAEETILPMLYEV